jgi:hypothetical protein
MAVGAMPAQALVLPQYPLAHIAAMPFTNSVSPTGRSRSVQSPDLRGLLRIARRHRVQYSTQAATTEPADDGSTYIYITGHFELNDSVKFADLVDKKKIEGEVF